MLSGCATMFSLHNKLNDIGVEVQRVHVESIISSGKAIYMPGSVCIIKATSDIDVTKMREFASACINSHNDWLLINSSNTSYSDAMQEIQQ